MTRILDMTKHGQNNYTRINIKTFKKKINNYLFYEERAKSFASHRHRRKSCVLFTYGFNIKRKNIKEKKEVLEVLIHFS